MSCWDCVPKGSSSHFLPLWDFLQDQFRTLLNYCFCAEFQSVWDLMCALWKQSLFLATLWPSCAPALLVFKADVLWAGLTCTGPPAGELHRSSEPPLLGRTSAAVAALLPVFTSPGEWVLTVPHHHAPTHPLWLLLHIFIRGKSFLLLFIPAMVAPDTVLWVFRVSLQGAHVVLLWG